MTEAHAIIAAEIEAEIAAERYQAAYDAHDHPEYLASLFTEVERTQRYFETMLLEGGNA